MPIVASGPITTIRGLIAYHADDLTQNSGPLGVGFVGTYDERLIPNYPAVVVSAGTREKELHGTHTYLYTIRIFFYIMHALLTADHRMRNEEDLMLAERVEAHVERDKTLGDSIIFGYVENEIPGALVPRSEKGSAVVSTRLTYQAVSEGRF